LEVDKPERLIVDGKRLDGRKLDEPRSVKMVAGPLKRADGSAFVEWGKNKALASIYGPGETHPRHLQESDRAILQVRYNMASFSVEDRKRPGPDRRSAEISKVTKEALEPAVFLAEYPRSSIEINIEILQADAGTRCTGINAASLALADAGIPMRDLVVALAFGKIDGEVCLDLNKDEDNYGEADVPVAVMPRKKLISLLQMDGDLSRDEFNKGLDMVMDSVDRIHQIQRDALMEKYKRD
jgi:exosome complex component RRP41